LRGLYKPKTRVGKYYVILFSLPKWQYLTLALLFLTLLLLLTAGGSSYPLLINALLVFLYTRIYAVIYKNTVFYKIKRSLGLALAVLVYSSLILFFTKNTPLIVTSSATLTIVVILGLDGTSLLRYIPAILPQLTTLITMAVLNYVDAVALFKWLLVLLLIVLVDVAIYAYISRRKLKNTPLPELGTLFLRNWLDRRVEIEEVFSKIGEDTVINPRIIELGDLLVIYTDVHYGPFSNIGSSKLPGLLVDEFKRLRKHVIALHGLGSHDRNIVSSEYIAKYRESLLNEYLSGDRVKLLYHGGFCSNYYEWVLCGLVFDKLSLVFISRPHAGIDDIPYSIQFEYDLKARRLGLGELILVDSHNWELQKPLELDKLRESLDIALERIKEIKRRPPSEILHRHVCFKARAHGLIDGDLCILCIEGVDKERFCLIYARGNNMKPRVRDLVLEHAKALGIHLVEVITNDEHSETGIRPSITYIPVHESSEMLKAIQEKSLELLKTQPSAEAWLYVLRLNTKLMGEAAECLEELLGSSIREAAALLLSYVCLTPLVLQLVSIFTGFL
jgi:putative membrane protein